MNATAIPFRSLKAEKSELRALEVQLRVVEEKLKLWKRADAIALRNSRRAGGEAAQRILAAVCKYYFIPASLILSRGRTQAVADARQVAMHLIYTRLNLTSNEVGSMFDRDHGTVLWATESVCAKLDTDPVFKNRFEAVILALDRSRDREEASAGPSTTAPSMVGAVAPRGPSPPQSASQVAKRSSTEGEQIGGRVGNPIRIPQSAIK